MGPQPWLLCASCVHLLLVDHWLLYPQDALHAKKCKRQNENATKIQNTAKSGKLCILDD